LVEWEKENPPENWPNLVVVLGEGMIHHYGRGVFRRCLTNDEISKGSHPVSSLFRKDTFFQFYSRLLQLCGTTTLVPPKLSDYYDLPKVVGKYRVKGHDQIVRKEIKGGAENFKVMELTESFFDRIVPWCRASGKMKLRTVCEKMMGMVASGIDEKILESEVYFYDPDSLPSGFPETAKKTQSPSMYVSIDGEIYYFSQAYFGEGDLREAVEKAIDDL
jgi:hypothetical protein